MKDPTSIAKFSDPDDDHVANVEEYPDARKIARKLSGRQVRLLHALAEAHEKSRASEGTPTFVLKRLALHPDDGASAMGLQRRGLIRTERSMQGSVWSRSRRPVPGSKRWAWILPKGLAVVRFLPPPPAQELLEVVFVMERVHIRVDGLTAATGTMFGDVLVVDNGGAKLDEEQWAEVARRVRERLNREKYG